MLSKKFNFRASEETVKTLKWLAANSGWRHISCVTRAILSGKKIVAISCAMKNSIRLDIIHPEKARVEHFLNNVDEDLQQIPFDVRELRGIDDIIAGFKFKVKGRTVFVIVIFAESYSHANKIEAANLATIPNIKRTINGAILYGVDSVDEHVSKEMLSFFAGRE